MTEKSKSEVRRRDRAKDDEWTRAFIGQARAGVLATVRGEQPFINTNLFVYGPWVARDLHAHSEAGADPPEPSRAGTRLFLGVRDGKAPPR